MRFLAKEKGDEPVAKVLADSDLCPDFPPFGLHTCADCKGIEEITITLPGAQGVEFRLSMDPDEFAQLKDCVQTYSDLHRPHQEGASVVIHEGTETKQ